MVAGRDLLLSQMDKAFSRLWNRIEGLGDAEYFWQPVPHCWTIHRDGAGAWVHDYVEPDPEPPPFTTIGWRLAHLADCKVMYHEWAYGARRLTFPDLPALASVGAAREGLGRGHRLLRADLEGLAEGDLDQPRLTNWGELWPAWRIFSVMTDHDAHHGGEIGTLRDLYRELEGAAAGAI